MANRKTPHQRLLDMFKNQNWWGMQAQSAQRADLKIFRAFRETDRDELYAASPSQSRNVVSGRDGYVVDPLAKRMVGAWGEMIFGSDPVFTPANDGDAENLTRIVTENDTPSELQRAEPMCASEGEVWYRIVADPDALDAPMIEWHSRLNVWPLWSGKKIVAIAFVNVLEAHHQTERHRHVEIMTPDANYNHLFKGTRERIGDEVDLSERDETDGVPRVWDHNLGCILGGRIVNELGSSYWWGLSDLDPVRDLLFALNESASIGMSNARLTAKARLIVPEGMIDTRTGTFDAMGMDVIQAEMLDTADGQKQSITQVETSFDAQALITYDDALAKKILTRTGVAPQLVGMDMEGHAEAGTAIRTRVMHSILVANAKARYWDDELPQAYLKLQKVDALSRQKGGFGRSYSDLNKPPSLLRGEAITPELQDLIHMEAEAVGAELRSVEEGVRRINPDKHDDPEWIKAEVKRIRDDKKMDLPQGPGIGSGDNRPGVGRNAPRPGSAPDGVNDRFSGRAQGGSVNQD